MSVVVALFRRLRALSFNQVAGAVSLLALLALSYVLGAAAMHFGLPFSGFLGRAFLGAELWTSGLEGEAAGSAPAGSETPAGSGTGGGEGFTLFTTSWSAGATLLDGKGNVVHRWKMPARRFWEREENVRDPLPDESIHWERGLAFADGGVLALCAGKDTPYGYGLARLDRNSRPLWGCSASVHHDFDVGEDGRIYALTQTIEPRPPAGLPWLTGPYTAEFLVVLSPEGKELKKLSLLDALRRSPYLLPALTSPTPEPGGPPGPSGPGGGLPGGPGGPFPPGPPNPGHAHTPMHPFGPPVPRSQLGKGDVLHSNSVKVLSKSLAAKFPLFRPGQVLLSFRSPSMIAVLDVEKGSVVWAARGAWQAQHDAQFLPSGRLLLFDNLGDFRGARVLEYDPVTQAIPWWFSTDQGGPFVAPFRGGSQRLPGGNTLIVDPGRRLFEVTPAGQTAWEWHLPTQGDQPAGKDSLNFTGARRYSVEELPFLK